jgi:UDP-N-acetylmuramyl tripeptide synthase
LSALKAIKLMAINISYGAIANGAAAVVVEDYQAGWDIPQIRVANSRQGLAALSDNFMAVLLGT